MKVEPAGRGVYVVEHDGARDTVYVAGLPGRRWAFWNGQVFRQQGPSGRDENRGRRTSRGVGAELDVLTAPMPGTVLRVTVERGARVRKGDTLIVIEAMKMEIPLRAPRDGVVRTVSCREGELVQPDVDLVEIE